MNLCCNYKYTKLKVLERDHKTISIKYLGNCSGRTIQGDCLGGNCPGVIVPVPFFLFRNSFRENYALFCYVLNRHLRFFHLPIYDLYKENLRISENRIKNLHCVELTDFKFYSRKNIFPKMSEF